MKGFVEQLLPLILITRLLINRPCSNAIRHTYPSAPLTLTLQLVRHEPAGGNLLYVEVQMARELQFSGEDLLVDTERIVVKERRVPAGGEEERNEGLSQIL